jgi:hypothetical protein
MREAAHQRARVMVYSGAWVLSERDPHYPRLQLEEDEVIKSYMALRKAVR